MKHFRTSLQRQERMHLVPIEKTDQKPIQNLTIDSKVEKQTMIGFGGAFTEASAYNLSRIHPDLREKAIKAYFDPNEGIGYNMGRVSIHGCDFSLGSYLYIDDYDDTLDSFNIQRDKMIIKLIQDAQKYVKSPLKVIASPWTPPFWMKDNHSPIFGGKLKIEYDQIWANYFVKFIDAYEKEGVHIFAVTIQNEPLAKQRWDSCIYESEDELRFLKVLGPTLEKANYADKHILIWDHNRDVMVERASHIYNDPIGQKYAWGTAFHWYDQEQFQEVLKHHELFPNKHLVFTEGCQENGPHFDEYHVGERYGRNLMNDLKNYTEAYVDWNLFLDDTGGPNHVNNLCSAPAMFKIFRQELVLNPSYYYIGHFSKFIKPGAIQLASSGTSDVSFIAFRNVDNSQVLVLMNEQDEDFNIHIKGLKEDLQLLVLGHSISTIVI